MRAAPQRVLSILALTLIASPCLADVVSVTFSPAHLVTSPVGTPLTVDIDFTFSSTTGDVVGGPWLGSITTSGDFTNTGVSSGCGISQSFCDIFGTFDPTDTTTVSTMTASLQAVDTVGNILASATGTITAMGTPAVPEVPLPGTLSLFAGGLGALGLLGWRRKRKAQAVA